MSKPIALIDDGCTGDSDGLRTALGEGSTIVWTVGTDEGYGHHSTNTLWLRADGQHIFAECGGCSCEGSGHWQYVDSEPAGRLLVPEWMREQIQ